MSDADKSTDCNGISTTVRHCYGCTKVSTLEARIAELERERGEGFKAREAGAAHWYDMFHAEADKHRQARARIAELERERNDQGEVIRQQETECMRRVARNATLASDYREAEARVAKLAREMGAMAAALKDAVATNEELRAERDEAAKLLGTVVCIGTLMEGEELVTDPRHAATGAILGWRSAAFAARADLDEAVGLLERVDDRVDFATGGDEGSRDHNDVLNDVRAWRLARIAAPAPDKEPRQPGPGSRT